ncbi:hypothetical protein PUN28_003898 [Cardiocondyla obscurior]|uniref:Tudor domain-containing protein n=1 Tax=Cardiocondyla obscurior TaxID=286306 RepID=A0AAW2GKS0_9HYME
MNKQSVLPILCGISLTTFGLSVAILLYGIIFEKEENEYDKKKKCLISKKSKSKEITLDIVIPEKYVSAIIGKGGAVVKKIQELTSTHITMEKKGLNQSSERLCQIRSDNIQNIHSAQNMIQNIIQSLPDIETFEMFIPFEAFDRVFKKKNHKDEFLQQIKKIYGIKVIIDGNTHVTKTGINRRIILKGNPNQLAPALIEIEDKIQQEAKILSQMKSKIASARIFRNSKNVIKTLDDYSNEDVHDHSLSIKVCEKFMENNECKEDIEKISGAKIIITDDKTTECKERKGIIRGTTKQIDSALNAIENKFGDICESRFGSNVDVTIKKLSESLNDISSISTVLDSPLKQNDLMEVYVSALNTPNMFWIQVIGSANIELQQLELEMTEYYNNAENRKNHMLKNITEGQMVAAKFKYDNKWYRAEVISVINSSEYQVFFVDYGDVDQIFEADICELRTDMLSLRHQALECSLANLKPLEGTWNTKTIDKFAELVYLAKWIPLVAKVKSYKEYSVDSIDGDSRCHKSLILYLDLYDKNSNQSIGDQLIQLGMAKVEEKVWSAVNSALPNNECNFPFNPFLPDQFSID